MQPEIYPEFLQNIDEAQPGIYHPSLEEIAQEWNENISSRVDELESGDNSTYFNVIVPHIRQSLYSLAYKGAKVLDIGCGLGHLTNLISKWGYDTAGIDIAGKAIEYARRSFTNPHFQQSSIVEFADTHSELYDICIVNMVLHNLVDLENNLLAIHHLLKDDGLAIVSIPDPKLWFPKHIGAAGHHFLYGNRKVCKVRFKVRNGVEHPSPVTYIHRPLNLYADLIKANGFEILRSEHPITGSEITEEDLLFCVWKKT